MKVSSFDTRFIQENIFIMDRTNLPKLTRLPQPDEALPGKNLAIVVLIIGENLCTQYTSNNFRYNADRKL